MAPGRQVKRVSVDPPPSGLADRARFAAFVTGGRSGIERATARRLARDAHTAGLLDPRRQRGSGNR
jgi:hypothetical protein